MTTKLDPATGETLTLTSNDDAQPGELAYEWISASGVRTPPTEAELRTHLQWRRETYGSYR